jgi:hypothetical protein
MVEVASFNQSRRHAMWVKTATVTALMGSLALGPVVGCSNLPGDEKQQGAVIGGVGGALAGAAVAGKDDRLIGALLGGALGAGGGYLIGMKVDEKNNGKDADAKREAAIKASKDAEANPVSAQQAKNATTADVNDDGFVTLDEVVALEQAGTKDKDIIKKLQRTQQVFELTDTQEQYLRDHNVTDTVIVAMRDMNRASSSGQLASDRSDSTGSERIGKKAE